MAYGIPGEISILFALERIFMLCVIPSLKFLSHDALCVCSVLLHYCAMAFLRVDVVPVISELLQVQIGRPSVHLYKTALLH